MTIRPNITDFSLYKRQNYNPLFDSNTDEFDKVFKERYVSDEYIIDNLYIDNRPEVSVLNEGIYTLLQSKPKIIKKQRDFKNSLQENRKIDLRHV